MLDLLCDRFCWPGITIDVDFHIVKCQQCIKFKGRPQRTGMENTQATYPLRLVHLDYLTIGMTEGGKDTYILIIMDHFTRCMQALEMSLQIAKGMAQALWD